MTVNSLSFDLASSNIHSYVSLYISSNAITVKCMFLLGFDLFHNSIIDLIVEEIERNYQKCENEKMNIIVI